MSRTKKTGITILAVLATSAIAVPIAAARPIENTQPTAAPVANTQPSVDLRSPDARDAALAATSVPNATTEPVVRPGLGTFRPGPASGLSAATAPVTRQEAAPDSPGFDWGDAGVGAVGALSLLGLSAGTVVLARRTRQRHAAIG
jgi:hypothetical protein